MQNLVKTVETTKAYADAFNARDMVRLAELLAEDNVIFSRQEQNTIVGKELVLRRMRNLFWRLDQQHKELKLITAIADIGQTKARPCLIGYMDGVAVSLCVISCKVNGLINAIAILLNSSVVATARPTEKIEKDEDSSFDTVEKNEEVKTPSLEAVQSREKWLADKEREYRIAIEKSGKTPELMAKVKRLLREKKKLENIKKKMR